MDRYRLVIFLYQSKSIKYVSIKYLSHDNKLTVSLLDIVKTAILNTYYLRIFEQKTSIFSLFYKKFERPTFFKFISHKNTVFLQY